ncbi:uncharacterized protein LOC134820061 [Bolinopsis microptera]|uniref:uncharacterized protein LOC134820061 n=1 Tax=Bolinopsis microptera TaxID=2820187 RepID=UPI00307A8AAF
MRSLHLVLGLGFIGLILGGRCYTDYKYDTGMFTDSERLDQRLLSLGNCQEWCDETPRCKGVVLSPVDWAVRECYLVATTHITARSGWESSSLTNCGLDYWSKNAGKYLSGYSAGTAKYDSLLKAQSECLKRSDCGGITYETSSRKFTLRTGIDLKDSSSSEISWIYNRFVLKIAPRSGGIRDKRISRLFWPNFAIPRNLTGYTLNYT